MKTIKNIDPEKGLRSWWNLLWVRPGDIVYVQSSHKMYGNSLPGLCIMQQYSSVDRLYRT